MPVPSPPRWHPDIFTVGVTGTNGKTTTTSWIAAALACRGTPVARATTIGFFVGSERIDIAKSYDGFLRGMSTCRERGGRFAAIELTSEALSSGFARAWPCNVGVFTNLTHDHLDAHGSPEHYLASKAQLFVSLPENGVAVLNASDPVFEMLREVIPPHVRVMSYAAPARGAPQGKPDLLATSVSVSWDGTRVRCDGLARAEGAGQSTRFRPRGSPEASRRGFPRDIHVRAIGDVFAENALAAMLGAIAAGVAPEDAAHALSTADVPPGRFEVVHERPWVVVDYAHTPDALARTVATARALSKHSRLFVVFGAGGKRDRAKRAPMGEAARPADVVVLTSDNPRDEDPSAIAAAIAVGLRDHPNVRIEIDRRAAITTAVRAASRDDVILIAGKGHETDQTIGSEVRPFSDAAVAREALA